MWIGPKTKEQIVTTLVNMKNKINDKVASNLPPISIREASMYSRQNGQGGNLGNNTNSKYCNVEPFVVSRSSTLLSGRQRSTRQSRKTSVQPTNLGVHKNKIMSERKSQEMPGGRMMNNFGFKKRLVQKPDEKNVNSERPNKTPKIEKPLNVGQSPKAFPFKPTGKFVLDNFV